jgi:hypothetical protein
MTIILSGEHHAVRDAVRPLLRKHIGDGSSRYPYLWGGTSFVVGFDQVRLVVTPDHVAFNGALIAFNRAASLTTLLRIDGQSGEMAHFTDLYHSPTPPPGHSPELADVTFLAIQHDQVERVEPYWSLTSPGARGGCGPVEPGHQMIGYGYPMDVPSAPVLDYDLDGEDGSPGARTLHTRPWAMAGTFLRWDNAQESIGVMELDGMFDGNDQEQQVGLNGFSGSPVFIGYPNGKSWGGMVITGGAGVVRFIRSDVITTLIRQLPLPGYGAEGT